LQGDHRARVRIDAIESHFGEFPFKVSDVILTAGSILLGKTGSNCRAKVAPQAIPAKTLKQLSYRSIYHAPGRQFLPSPQPIRQILPGNFWADRRNSTNRDPRKRNAGRPEGRPALIASLSLVADHLKSDRID
jgi:hypothetical protein